MSQFDVDQATQALIAETLNGGGLGNAVIPDEVNAQDDTGLELIGDAPKLTNAPKINRQNPKNADGSYNFEDGSRFVPSTGMLYQGAKGPNGETFVVKPDGKLYTSKPPLGAAHHQLADFTDTQTGQPYKALVDMNTGEQLKRYDDPSSRANAQAEMLRVRMLNSAKSQPAIVGYVNVKNNYDSLVQNAAIPPDQRTGADDAAAIQAFGAIEHPGTGVTDTDKKQAQSLVPIWDSLKLKGKNFMENKANTLTPEVVNQMRDAAKRALDGRQQTYNEQIAPLLKEAGRVGLKPEDVNGVLGANIMSPNAEQATQPVAAQSSIPHPASQEEYDALPPLAKYIGSDGKVHIKQK